VSALGRLAGLGRSRWSRGSALREPSPVEVYEGRLPEQARREPVRRKPVGVNFLDGRECVSRWRPMSSGTARLVVPASPSSPSGSPSAAPAGWVPWCGECQQPPVGGPWTLQGAEYLARQHDIVWHGGAWTAQAMPAGEVTALVAALPNGGVR
jgi:hypothetical protein